jgi:hypothetical protein
VKDISYLAAFPKSGITYLNFMLLHILFDRPQDARLIDGDYISRSYPTPARHVKCPAKWAFCSLSLATLSEGAFMTRPEAVFMPNGRSVAARLRPG